MNTSESLKESAATLAATAVQCADDLAIAANILSDSLRQGGTAYFCGNGGSASDAQHLAAELAGRFYLERPAMAGVALTTNTSSITAIGNDYGYEFVFSRQLEGVGEKGDVLVAITTSGSSKNILEAIKVARRLDMRVIGMTGTKGSAFAALCDVALITPSDKTPRIQEGHIAMGHALCEYAEAALFGSNDQK